MDLPVDLATHAGTIVAAVAGALAVRLRRAPRALPPAPTCDVDLAPVLARLDALAGQLAAATSQHAGALDRTHRRANAVADALDSHAEVEADRAAGIVERLTTITERIAALSERFSDLRRDHTPTR